MPLLLADILELDLTGMNIDAVSHKYSVLEAQFGDGRSDGVRVGDAGGTQSFRLSAGVLPDDAALGSLINGVPRFEYYYEFYKARMRAGNQAFAITHRGRKYHVKFETTDFSYEVFTADLFQAGIALRQARVQGIYYTDDGYAYDPTDVASLWGGWMPSGFVTISDLWNGEIGSRVLNMVDDVEELSADQNGLNVLALSQTTNDGMLQNIAIGTTIYDVMMVMKMREATFSNNCGILTGDGGSDPQCLLGSSGTTKFQDLSLGGTYSYRLNGTQYAANNQQAPMNEYGVVHIRYTTGWNLAGGFQFGKNRTTGSTFAEANFGEIWMSSTALTAAEYTDLQRYLTIKWRIT